MTWEEVCALAGRWPLVEVGTAHGNPALRAAGKFLTRLRPDEASVVLLEVGFDEREMLMEAEPQTFYITPHYRDWPSVLARLDSIDSGSLAQLLYRRWRKVTPKRVVKAYESEGGGP